MPGAFRPEIGKGFPKQIFSGLAIATRPPYEAAQGQLEIPQRAPPYSLATRISNPYAKRFCVRLLHTYPLIVGFVARYRDGCRLECVGINLELKAI